MKVLLADDHSIVREGLKFHLKSIKECDLIDEAYNGDEAWRKIRDNQYDMAILDISMPEMGGLDVLRKIRDAKIEIRILILSIFPQEQYAIQSFKLGAAGYLSKDTSSDELTYAIKKILSGGKYIGNTFAEQFVSDLTGADAGKSHEKLSRREFQIMLLLAKGKSTSEIGEELLISPRTVSTYRFRIMKKMNMSKNAELISYAIRNNLIE